MPSIANIRAANLGIGSSFPYQPVAVFVGGTSGIGAGMARAFARHRNGDAHIVLVGRNRAAAEEVIASFPKPADKSYTHEFVECDATLMRNVRHTTAELSQRLPKINFLVMSPGIMTMQGRVETEEGIDRKLALHYYARWRFTYDLVPLLQKAKDAGEDAKVLSVLSAGVDGGEIDINDLGLKKGFTLAAAARAASTYNDLAIQSFAQKYPDISFLHSAPGIVSTKLGGGMTVVGPILGALAHVLGISPDDCGEYMSRALYAAGKGWSRWNRRGENEGEKNMWSTPEAQEKLWEHTVTETS